MNQPKKTNRGGRSSSRRQVAPASKAALPVLDGRTAKGGGKRPKVGSTVELGIDELTHTGEGLARLEGYILFVRDALPGERVLAKVVQAKDRFGRATILKRLETSKRRVEPRCQHFGECGRCSLQHLAYSEQLAAKRQLLATTLERALPALRLPVKPMRGQAQWWGTRNKAHFVVGEKDDQAVLGHFAANSKRLVPIVECPVHHPAANQAAFALAEALRNHRIQPFREQTGKGIAKHVVARASSSANEALVLLVATTDRLPAASSIAAATMEAAPTTVGVHLNRNPLPGPVIMGSSFVQLAGKSQIVERLAGIDFLLSPTAFFQTSAEAAAILVDAVLRAVPARARNVLDLYCGIGLFSLPLAKRGVSVLGIEQNPRAVEDAIATAAANAIAGCEFQAGKTEDLLKSLPRERKFDAVVLDPPRDGAPEWVLRLIAHRLRPQTIVDVSCDAESLARDLKLLVRLGYDVVAIEPIDMFPHTMQIESVATLTRRDRDAPRSAARRKAQPARPSRRGPVRQRR